MCRAMALQGRAVGSGGSIRIAWLGLLLLPTATQAFSILSSVAKSRKRGSRCVPPAPTARTHTLFLSSGISSTCPFFRTVFLDSDHLTPHAGLATPLVHVRRQPARSPGLVANLINNWANTTKMPRRAYFPYGQPGFAQIREQGRFYVDRTKYIEALEAFEYQCFTRPPRWGKSCLVELLACYYDNATTPEEWDTWFGGLDIHKKPTELKGMFEVLQLDFSRAATGGVPEMKARLNTHINLQCTKFAIKYGYTSCTELSALRRVDFHLDYDDAMTTLTSLTKAVKARGKQLYLFIDEYDRFANHFLLEREEFDTWGYRAAVVDAASPIKQIFTTLKSLQARGLSRLFITGLLRLAFSDASGSNTIELTSAEEAVGPCLGFPLKNITYTLGMLELGAEGEERARFEAEALSLITTYFNGYRFPGVDDVGLYCPQLCMQIFRRLCDKKNWEYLDEKNPALFWRGLPKKDLMSALGDQNSDPSRSALRLLAQLPDAANELRDLTNGPVASLRTDLGSRHTFGVLLGTTDSKDSRRTAFLGFMYDQGLVTLGTGDSLTFPNDVVRLLVNETTLENKRVRVRRRLKQAWLFISEPVLGRIKGLLAPSAGP